MSVFQASRQLWAVGDSIVSSAEALSTKTMNPACCTALPSAEGDAARLAAKVLNLTRAVAEGTGPALLEQAAAGTELPTALSEQDVSQLRHHVRMQGLHLEPPKENEPAASLVQILAYPDCSSILSKGEK